MLFDLMDVKKIFFVPVGSLENEDSLARNHSKDGVYNIRSGYREKR